MLIKYNFIELHWISRVYKTDYTANISITRNLLSTHTYYSCLFTFKDFWLCQYYFQLTADWYVIDTGFPLCSKNYNLIGIRKSHIIVSNWKQRNAPSVGRYHRMPQLQLKCSGMPRERITDSVNEWITYTLDLQCTGQAIPKKASIL